MAEIDAAYKMLQRWAKINTYQVYKGTYAARKDRGKKER